MDDNKQNMDKPPILSNYPIGMKFGAFLLALFFIISINIASYRQVNNLISANNWVSHSYQVIQAANTALYTIIDIESHQRGYLVTGNKQFLSDMESRIPELNKILSSLIILTRDNAAQNAQTIYFTKVINARLAKLYEVLKLKANNQLNTQDGMNLFYKGQLLSDQIRSSAHEIINVELTLLSNRNEAVIANANLLNLIFIGGNIICIALLVFIFILFYAETLRRTKVEQALSNIESELRSIIEGASDMIAALDMNYRYFIFNEAYQREFKFLFGKQIAIGMHLDEALDHHPEAKVKLSESWKASLEGKEYVKNFDFQVGEDRYYYEVTSSLIKNNENKIIGAVHIIRNITKQAQEQNRLKYEYEMLNLGMLNLKDRNQQITTLVEMSDILLACDSLSELSNVVSKYCQKILKNSSGILYIMHPSKNYLEISTNWRNSIAHDTVITPEQCWAIRLGRPHNSGAFNSELKCQHIKNSTNSNISYHCIPLMAKNDIYGLLFLEMKQDSTESYSDNDKILTTALAELTALALANVRLRENLRHQSVRDPLTGLFNRRYLEEALNKQIHQSERNKATLAVLMLDLDHFKKINDTFGHDAGDMVLKEFGDILQKVVRVGDIASRYGGEEFIIVLHDADLAAAKQPAEKIKQSVKSLRLKYGSQPVGPLTVSIGISSYPEYGKTPEELINTADKALYLAKKNGRDQIVTIAETYAELTT